MSFLKQFDTKLLIENILITIKNCNFNSLLLIN